MLRRDGRGPWERVPLNGDPQIASISGAGALRVAVGYPHTTLLSRDGGGKWQNKAVGARRKLTQVVCLSASAILATGDGPLEVPGHAPSFHLLRAAARVSPSGRYLMWASGDGWVVRDGDDARLPVVATAPGRGAVAPLVELDRIVGIDDARGRIVIFDLTGNEVAKLAGLARATSYGTKILASSRGRAFLTVSRWDAVRRWPLP